MFVDPKSAVHCTLNSSHHIVPDGMACRRCPSSGGPDLTIEHTHCLIYPLYGYLC